MLWVPEEGERAVHHVRTPISSWKPSPGVDFTPYRQSYDAMFSALASPARRRILHYVGTGVTSPAMLSEYSGVSPSTVCHHLKVLERASLIERCPAHLCTKVNRSALKAFRDYMQHYF